MSIVGGVGRNRQAFSGRKQARKGLDVNEPEAGRSLSAIAQWSRWEDMADCGQRREGGSER